MNPTAEQKNVSSFKIWVDADSCPIPVRELVLRFAKRLQIPLVFVANRDIPLEENPLFTMLVCESEPDAADNYIVDNSTVSDLVVTRDIPLAARLVKKNVCTINDRGIVFTKENINEKLALRNLNMELFEYGLAPEKNTCFGKKELNNFANSLDRELHKLLKKQDKP